MLSMFYRQENPGVTRTVLKSAKSDKAKNSRDTVASLAATYSKHCTFATSIQARSGL
jgi:hypothetical protein